MKEIKIKLKKFDDITNDFRYSNIESKYGNNSLYFTVDGKPCMLVSGEFHFSRYDRECWRDELLKMKECGVDIVATYIFWNHLEPEKDKFDFTGNNDIKYFLKICKEVGMPCLLRSGPWAHGEARYGGFPDYIQKGNYGRRKSEPKYMERVKIFWTKLYEQVKEYCDGETIFGMQLENEYTGEMSHIRDLRKLAIEIGFKVPFFTMTGWPTNCPDKEILGTFGAYPEAPWTYHKKRLTPAGRFAICEGRSEVEIGEDLIKGAKTREKVSFAMIPYAGCEVGAGNQVTQHRRPNIDDKDGYGVAFGKIASGMNLIGYYMFHGGRNPLGRMLQESKRTLYPNNYPIVDYDFQSPLSKNGDIRMHGHRLRLIHLFLHTYGESFATYRTYFSDEVADKYLSDDIPYHSVKMGDNGEGYVFISNYERGSDEITDKRVKIVVPNIFESPMLDVKVGEMFYFPFNMTYSDTKFDYVLAEPITYVENNGKKEYYFRKIYDKTMLSINGKVEFADNEYTLVNGDKFVFLDNSQAYDVHKINGKIVYSNGNIWEDNKKVTGELKSGQYIKSDELTLNYTDKINSSAIKFEQVKREKKPYNHYLYSYGKRKSYLLNVDLNVLKDVYDADIVFNFTGLNLQVFNNDLLIDDYFNTDGKYILKLSYIRKHAKDGKLLFVTVPPTSFGVGNVYNEINLKAGENNITIDNIIPIKRI